MTAHSARSHGHPHSPVGLHRREGAQPPDDIDGIREAVTRLQEMHSRWTLQLTDYLLRFGRHNEGCDPNSTTLRQCACGWLQAIAYVWPNGRPEGQRPGETGDEYVLRRAAESLS